MHHTKSKYLALALCLAIFPTTTMAAGLGKLNVVSGLGEPLKADIELLSVTADELASITAAIASNQAYTDQGIEKPASHNDIKIQVSKNARGAPILKLNSTQPITDAFLDMLIQVDWSSGRLLREYTLLLDPPGYAADSSAQSAVVKSATTAQTNSEANTAPKRAESSKSNDVVARPAKDQQSAAPLPEIAAVDSTEQTHETVRGDTLAKVASDMKPEGVSLEQMLVGLYQANPKAFDGKNMNRLKVGQILRAPDYSALESISKKSASNQVRVHAADWNAYKNKLAGIVADGAASDEALPSQSSSGKVMTAEDQAAPVNTGPKDVVKLSSADATAQKALEDKVIALQEEVIAKENALRDTQNKTADLQKQIADMKALMDLKNDTMARMQNDANAANQPQPPVPEAPVAAATEAVVIDTPAADASAAAATVVKPANTQPAANTPLSTPAPIAQPSFLSEMMTNLDSKTLGLAGAGLAVLVAGWLYLRNKRRKNLASFEEGIMTSGGLKANTVFGNTAGGTVDTGDTSFLTDFSQSPTGSMIDSHDVDPIAEAEVYMAYGRDAQAEEILKDAIVKEPKRHELHLKLLEIYQTNGNTSAFETISGELYTTLGPNDPTWEKVSQLGVKMDPDNPLYQVAATDHTAASAATQESSATDGAGYVAPLASAAYATTSDAAEQIDTTLSFDADSQSVEMAADTIGQASDFDFGATDNTLMPQTEAPVAAKAEAEESFDFNMDGLDFNLDSAETSDKLPSFESLPSFDLGSPTIDTDNTASEEVATFDLGDFSIESSTSDSLTNDSPVRDNAVSATPAGAEDEAKALTLDSPTISFASDSDDSNRYNLSDDVSPALTGDELPSLDLEAEQDASAAAASNSTDNAFDFAEDTDLGMTTAKSTDFDFSDISLDLGDMPSDDFSEEIVMGGVESLGNGLPGSEPEEVETKLDLVMAYLDMEDTIGARELLEEVMKEGGESQRKRAEELLAKIA